MMKRGYWKTSRGYVECHPMTKDVYFDSAARPEGGGWELVEFQKLPEGDYTLKFVDADVQLAVNLVGEPEVRPAGTAGSWERFQGGLTVPGGKPFCFHENGLFGWVEWE